MLGPRHLASTKIAWCYSRCPLRYDRLVFRYERGSWASKSYCHRKQLVGTLIALRVSESEPRTPGQLKKGKGPGSRVPCRSRLLLWRSKELRLSNNIHDFHKRPLQPWSFLRIFCDRDLGILVVLQSLNQTICLVWSYCSQPSRLPLIRRLPWIHSCWEKRGEEQASDNVIVRIKTNKTNTSSTKSTRKDKGKKDKGKIRYRLVFAGKKSEAAT